MEIVSVSASRIDPHGFIDVVVNTADAVELSNLYLVSPDGELVYGLAGEDIPVDAADQTISGVSLDNVGEIAAGQYKFYLEEQPGGNNEVDYGGLFDVLRLPTCAIGFARADPQATVSIDVNTTDSLYPCKLHLYRSGVEVAGSPLGASITTNTMRTITRGLPAGAGHASNYTFRLKTETGNYEGEPSAAFLINRLPTCSIGFAAAQHGATKNVAVNTTDALSFCNLYLLDSAYQLVAPLAEDILDFNGPIAVSIPLAGIAPTGEGYSFQIITNDPEFFGPASATFEIIAAASVPLVAGDLSRTARTDTTITLAWTDATGGSAPITAQLQKSAHGADTWSNVAGGTTSPGVATGSSNTLYDFRVVWTDDAEQAATSSTISSWTEAAASDRELLRSSGSRSLVTRLN